MGFIFGNATERSGWVSEPDTRGTFGILSACVVTTLLCVWTALHLNVPLAIETQWRWYGSIRFWRKAVWLFLGLLAPDLVVYTAWSQFTEARKVLGCKRKFEKTERADGQAKPCGDLESGDWTMAHAFYAVMGGFVLKPPKASKFLPGKRDRMTLSANGVRYLIEHQPELLPRLSKDDIFDRSKASAFAKTLVCIQASWFILQCLTRIATSLPISLLEINTLGHAVGALIMYAFWWHKPLDVEQPTIVDSPEGDKILAYLYMITAHLPVTYRRFYSEKPEAADIGFGPQSDTSMPASGFPTRSAQLVRKSAFAVWRRRIATWLTKSPLYHRVNDSGFELLHAERQSSHSGLGEENTATITLEDLLARQKPTFLASGAELRPTGLRYKPGSTIMHPSDVLRWVLALDLLKDTELSNSGTDSNWDSMNFVADRTSDLPPLDLDPNHLNWHLLLAFDISSMLYGGLHALAWNADFRSDTQKGLWRLSSLGVMCFFAISTLILTVERLLFQNRKSESVGLKASYFVVYRLEIAGTTFIAGLLTFLAARMYLLVECYITLMDLPKEAYDMPQWPRYIPHV